MKKEIPIPLAIKEKLDPSRRVNQLIPRFRSTYPNATTELHFSNPLQLLIATILSAQCTDVQVNLSTPALFGICKSANDYVKIPLEKLESTISKINFYHGKARNIKAMAQILVEKHDGKVPQTMDELTELPGVGRKTANVVLGNAFGINVGVVVDTHVTRLSQRLSLTRHKQPEKIEQVLIKLVPREEWTIFPHWLILHGRRRCFARNPDCLGCEVKDLCPSFPILSKQQIARNKALQKRSNT